MEFFSSSESYIPAHAALALVENAVEQRMQRMADRSPFSDWDLCLRYVPIVMPQEMLDRYKARSKADPKRRILDCAPQLPYEVFVGGTFEAQVLEYVGGLRTASLLLPRFGIAECEIQQFERELTDLAEACAQSSSSS